MISNTDGLGIEAFLKIYRTLVKLSAHTMYYGLTGWWWLVFVRHMDPNVGLVYTCRSCFTPLFLTFTLSHGRGSEDKLCLFVFWNKFVFVFKFLDRSRIFTWKRKIQILVFISDIFIDGRVNVRWINVNEIGFQGGFIFIPALVYWKINKNICSERKNRACENPTWPSAKVISHVNLSCTHKES